MEKYVFQSHMDWVLIPTIIICLITALKRSFSINNHINTWIHVAGKYLFEFTSYTLCYNLFSVLIFLKYIYNLATYISSGVDNFFDVGRLGVWGGVGWHLHMLWTHQPTINELKTPEKFGLFPVFVSPIIHYQVLDIIILIFYWCDLAWECTEKDSLAGHTPNR